MHRRLRKVLLLSAMLLSCPLVARVVSPDSFEGEVVLRSTGDRGILIALDNTKSGRSDEVFTIVTRTPVGNILLRSESASIELTAESLMVTLPKEKRAFVFSVASADGYGSPWPNEHGSTDALRLPAVQRAGRRFDVERFDDAMSLVHQHSPKLRFRLDDLAVEVPASLQTMVDGSRVTPQNPYPPPDPSSGGGCLGACAVGCGVSKCSTACDYLSCAECTCSSAGASCTCRSYIVH
jgi:hypothetical protein